MFEVGDKVKATGGSSVFEVLAAGQSKLGGEWIAIDCTNGRATPVIRDAGNYVKVKPFFEEGKTYRHQATGNTFRVDTIRTNPDGTRAAFGLHHEKAAGRTCYRVRDESDFNFGLNQPSWVEV